MSEMRLQKYLSEQGILSRRAAEEEIRRGKITVNGSPAVLGMKIDPGRDTVLYRGKKVGAPRRHVYLMLNKPRGYVTTMHDEEGRPCVAQLVADVGTRVYPVGRLDFDSEGLLLFTNDGELANKLTHPRYHKSKVYHVKLRGEVSAEKIAALSRPMEIDGYLTKPTHTTVVTRKEDFTVLAMELFEGRNRQIRKMCESLGLVILSLKRISVGEVKLGNLTPGKWRYLTRSQVESLKK
ncbi:MAG: pseudouridine synthase [Clostridiales bacterium]|nr:MAG: pseudouridine synthase [Clostridiales bacterium]